jgi:hypothetical protein
MTEKGITDAKVKFKHDSGLGPDLLKISWVHKSSRTHLVSVTYQDAWLDEITMNFSFSTSEIQNTPIRVIETKDKDWRNMKIVVEKDFTVDRLIFYIGNVIRKNIRGSKVERIAFDFFCDLAERNDNFDRPKRSTEEEDSYEGIDFFVFVMSDYEKDSVKKIALDIKSERVSQKKTASKNREMKRLVSTICLREKKHLELNESDIVARMLLCANKNHIFNIDYSRPAVQ